MELGVLNLLCKTSSSSFPNGRGDLGIPGYIGIPVDASTIKRPQSLLNYAYDARKRSSYLTLASKKNGKIRPGNAPPFLWIKNTIVRWNPG